LSGLEGGDAEVFIVSRQESSAMFYTARATNALKRHHPAFWQRVQHAEPTEHAMLAGYWRVFLKQARKQRLGPVSAADRFVESTRPRGRRKPFKH
jgi:hypothetical protein